MRIDFEQSDLQPLIERITVEVIAQLKRDEAALGDRLTFTEAEAAALLSMEQYQLRDERRDKRITASVVRGGKIVYTRDDLLEYLKRRRWPVRKE
jgi:urease gamma subunit